jgi:hypothetical protein
MVLRARRFAPCAMTASTSPSTRCAFDSLLGSDAGPALTAESLLPGRSPTYPMAGGKLRGHVRLPTDFVAPRTQVSLLSPPLLTFAVRSAAQSNRRVGRTCHS